MSRTETIKVSFGRGPKGAVRLMERDDDAGPTTRATPQAVPRLAKLMALAIRFDELVRSGVVANFADLSRLGRVSRARLSQVMNLLNLAPDLQSEILFLHPATSGKERLTERHVRPIASIPAWDEQRRRWRELCARIESGGGNGEG